MTISPSNMDNTNKGISSNPLLANSNINKDETNTHDNTPERFTGYKKIVRICNKMQVNTDYKINSVFFIETVIFIIFKNKSFECLKVDNLFNGKPNKQLVIFNNKITHIELINKKTDEYLFYTNEGEFIYNLKTNQLNPYNQIKEGKKIKEEILIKQNSLFLKTGNKTKQYLKFTDLILKTFEYKNFYILSTEKSIYVFSYKKYLKPLKIFNTKLLNIYFTDRTIILECKSTDFYYLTLFLKSKLKIVNSKYFKDSSPMNETIMQTGIRFMHQNLIFKVFKTHLKIKEIIYKLKEPPKEEYKKKLKDLNFNVNSLNRIHKKNEGNIKRKFKRQILLIECKEILILKRLKIKERISLNLNTKKLIDFDYEKDNYIFLLQTKNEIFLIYKTPLIVVKEEISSFYKKICALKNIVFTKSLKCSLKGDLICLSILNELLIFKIQEKGLSLISNFVECDAVKNIERIKKGFLVSFKGNNLSNDYILKGDYLIKEYFTFPINYELLKGYKNILVIYKQGVLYFLKDRVYKTKQIKNIVFLEIKFKRIFLVNYLREVFVIKF